MKYINEIDPFILQRNFLVLLTDRETLSIQLVKMRRYGRDFYRGERSFISSDGFILSSNTRTQMFPRIGRLALPGKHSKSEEILTLEDCPYNRTYFDFMIKAIKEYNEKCRIYS